MTKTATWIPQAIWRVPREWPGERCYILCGGTSLRAQRHLVPQLRGRVMRSVHPPLCFLLPETKSEMPMKRLRALEVSSDGFKLAEADLETRGMGDLYGRKQWGVSDLGMEALKNLKLIQAARDEAQALVAHDPTLVHFPALSERTSKISKELHTE